MSPLLIFFAFLVTFLHEAKCEVERGCPQEDPEPCSCVEAYGNVFLKCSGLRNRHQLTDAFQKMAGYMITELQVKDSNVSHIPRDLFKDSPVFRIRVKNSLMVYLFDRELEYNANVLTEITLDRVDFEGGLDWDVLDNLVSLQTLTVSRSNVESVPYGASELELPLETLVLEDNFLKNVYDLAFQNFRSLKNLKMNKNYLSKYQRSMLSLPESGIQFLDLSDNELTSLPSDAFEGMEQLHSLLLSGNEFTVLEKSCMKNIFSSLFFLDLSNNPLKCSCEMAWLISDTKPFHMFGECTLSKDSEGNRNLRELTAKDFAQCFF